MTINSPRSIPELAQWAGKQFGNDEAIVDGDVRISFIDVAALALRATKSFIASGIKPGDNVAIWAPNSWAWIIAALGLQGAGALLVPINTRFKGEEAAYILEQVDAAALVTIRGFLDVDYLAELRNLAPNLRCHRRAITLAGQVDRGCVSFDEFLDHGDLVTDEEALVRIESLGPNTRSDIIFTSGTTGKPKGVVLKHGVSLEGYRRWAELFGLRRGDRYLIINPFFHCFGYKAGWLVCLLQGATALPVPVLQGPELLELIGTERVSALAGPPTLFLTLLDGVMSAELSSLRIGFVGATSVAPELQRKIRTELPFQSLTTGYGLTESTALVSMTRSGEDPDRVAFWNGGYPFPGVHVRIIDGQGNLLPPENDGEILVSGSTLMEGYFNDPQSTAAAIDAEGWLHTGDIGSLSHRGELRISDRIKDIYITGGFNVSPAEVEGRLLAYEQVSEVAVIGVPDSRLGEVGAAFVVVSRGSQLSADDVINWSREHLANFKVPRYVELVDRLPRNATGKVLKHELRHRWQEEKF